MKWCSPDIDSTGRISTPGESSRTMNWLSPACRCAGSSGAERASAKKASAWWAPEVHSLVPVMRQPPSTSTALVFTLARSDPDSGSLMPMAQQISPRAMPGRNRRFCSSVPYLSSDGAACRSATHWAATGAPTARSSSVTTKRSMKVRPCPPYSVGMVMPTQPRAARALVKSVFQRASQVSTPGGEHACVDLLAQEGAHLGSQRGEARVGGTGGRHQ